VTYKTSIENTTVRSPQAKNIICESEPDTEANEKALT
jgi:hypothetical protein